LGQQWAWNFRQPGVDGEFGTPDDIVTLNVLTVPSSAMPERSDDVSQGRPVVLNLSSKDVIHSFFVPDMRFKRDANPGAINEAWFMPIKDGTFDILCAELCGYAHYQMHGLLRVLPPDEWDTWQQEASRQALAAYDEADTEAQWAWEWQE
jgi:cytochrome c oxidase subunit 2